MSAPNTNVQKQQRRHRPALIGIAVAVVLGALFFLLNMGSAVDDDGAIIEEVENDTPLLLEEDGSVTGASD